MLTVGTLHSASQYKILLLFFSIAEARKKEKLGRRSKTLFKLQQLKKTEQLT